MKTPANIRIIGNTGSPNRASPNPLMPNTSSNNIKPATKILRPIFVNLHPDAAIVSRFFRFPYTIWLKPIDVGATSAQIYAQLAHNPVMACIKNTNPSILRIPPRMESPSPLLLSEDNAERNTRAPGTIKMNGHRKSLNGICRNRHAKSRIPIKRSPSPKKIGPRSEV